MRNRESGSRRSTTRWLWRGSRLDADRRRHQHAGLGFGWGGAPGLVVDAIVGGRVTLIVSAPLLEELDRVLRYPKLVPVFPEPDRVVALLARIGACVELSRRLSVVADEPDNRVLEAAVAGQADAIVTGDSGLLELRVFEGIPAFTAREVADLIAQQP